METILAVLAMIPVAVQVGGLLVTAGYSVVATWVAIRQWWKTRTAENALAVQKKMLAAASILAASSVASLDMVEQTPAVKQLKIIAGQVRDAVNAKLQASGNLVGETKAVVKAAGLSDPAKANISARDIALAADAISQLVELRLKTAEVSLALPTLPKEGVK